MSREPVGSPKLGTTCLTNCTGNYRTVAARAAMAFEEMGTKAALRAEHLLAGPANPGRCKSPVLDAQHTACLLVQCPDHRNDGLLPLVLNKVASQATANLARLTQAGFCLKSACHSGQAAPAALGQAHLLSEDSQWRSSRMVSYQTCSSCNAAHSAAGPARRIDDSKLRRAFLATTSSGGQPVMTWATEAGRWKSASPWNVRLNSLRTSRA